jgi:CoA:oxalate CoA-transferase
MAATEHSPHDTETERPDPAGEGPLSGVRVIDLTRALAGPFCTLVLAGLGADVIKVEDPHGGDISRGNSPYIGENGLSLAATGPDDMSLALLTRCRGKRSLTLDLKSPEAAGVFADLVASADVVVENFSAGTADRLGVGYGAASAANPQIVYCSITGFGAGNDPGVRAMDTIIQALSGAMMTSGAPEDPPVRVGMPLADVITPVWAVVGILAALNRRARTGVGDHVDVSMLGVLTSLVATEDWAALEALGQPLRTGPTLPRLAPFAMVAPQDKLAEMLFDAMGRPELGSDPRFATRDARVHHDTVLTAEIEDWSRERSVAEAVEALASRGVPVAPVREPTAAVHDPRVVAREETLAVEHPTFGPVEGLRSAGIPITLTNSHIGFDRPAPRLGEHTAEVLAEAAARRRTR